MAKRVNNAELEGVDILGGPFKNFSGLPNQYNPAGKRTFCIRLTEEQADAMAADGWNIKQLDPREEGDEIVYYIQARIRFDNVPPTIYILRGSNNKKIRLTEETIEDLDHQQIEWADVILSPYYWEIKTKDGVDSGITAYVKVAYFKILEDRFAEKYSDDDLE